MRRGELDLLGGSDALREEPHRLDAHRYLGFIVGDEHLALPIDAVREVARVPPITEVPRAPRVVRGVIALHGRIVTVIDLRRRLRAPDPPPGEQCRVLMVPSGDEDVALLVDGVTRIHRVAPGDIELAAALPGASRPHVVGVARLGPERDGAPTLVVLADAAALARLP
ncbi:MAG: chemotaxis protein CheW [Deltaproteobacteria bacterium]|nr:chemotaxis protein CheW [Myxococcales bacterium]MDP3218880.1 chemotaxis protein CheW [Deltaproteobacteria bacterium]